MSPYSGETQYNRDKLLQGQGVDTPLSETGWRQAEAVGQYLGDLRFNVVYASNLQRASQTAEQILRNNTHGSGMAIVHNPLLRERGFGVAEGHPKEDLKKMANAAGQSCRDYTPPGGETLDQVRLRFKEFLKVLFERMMDDHSAAATEPGPAGNGTVHATSSEAPSGSPEDGLQGVGAHVLAVTHGAYIRVAVRHFVEELSCSLPQGTRTSQLCSPCPNTGISRFVLTLRRAESGPVLTAVRCVFTNRKDHMANLKDDS